MYDWQELLRAAWEVLAASSRLVVGLVVLVLQFFFAAVWIGWWLLAADWRRLWPVLGKGAWAPVVLLILIIGLAWSAIVPADFVVFGVVVIPVGLAQLSAVAGWVAIALFCGWLQRVWGIEPAGLDFESVEQTSPGHAPEDQGHQPIAGH
ncbi:MAG: hypothetical protein C4297_10660 [Gemmataceae bacterium]